MAKYLIVNADDFGLCAAANAAVEELFETGMLKSSTVMTPCPAADDAIAFAVAHPDYAVGVHLTTTSEWPTYRWKPLTDGASLADETGNMWRDSRQFGEHATYPEIEAELHAQVDYVVRRGLHPSHLDNHMGSLYGQHVSPPRFGLLKHTLKVCGEYGLPFRMFDHTDRRLCPAGTPYAVFRLLSIPSTIWSRRYGVTLPDYLLFPDWTKELRAGDYDNYRRTILRLWTDLPEGITETYVHPCVRTEQLEQIMPHWRDRVWEYELMRDPDTHRYLKDHGVEMIGYRDLARLKKHK